MVKKYTFHGFPVLQNQELIGYVTRDKLMTAIEFLLSRDLAPSPERRCTFSKRRFASQSVDFENLSEAIEEALLQLRKELPQELVVNMFQKLVSVSFSVHPTVLIHVRYHLTEPSTYCLHSRGEARGHDHKNRHSCVAKLALSAYRSIVRASESFLGPAMFYSLYFIFTWVM